MTRTVAGLPTELRHGRIVVDAPRGILVDTAIRTRTAGEAGAQGAESALRTLHVAPDRIGTTAGAILARATTGVDRLSDPDRLALTPHGVRASLASRIAALSRAGTILGLDRPILSDPRDPDRWTEVKPPDRHASWLERICARVRP